MKLKLISWEFAVYKIDKTVDISEYIKNQECVFLWITPNEVSVTIASEVKISHYINKIDWWKIFELQGIFEFSESNVWITAKLSGILAEAGVSLCFVGTHDTDYIMVSAYDLTLAISAFEAKWIEIIY